jgi:lipopolysaccharide biosynthesis protein
MYVESVCSTCILEASVLHVSSVFSDVCLQLCLYECYMCAHMLHVFYLDVVYFYNDLFEHFPGVFTSILTVSNVYCKCFISMFQR